MLINAYELERAKAIIPDREAEIKNFQIKVQELVSAFTHSLQLNMDAEDRVRAEFQTRLDIKERSIADYQRQLAEEQEKSAALNETQAKLTEAQDTVISLKAELDAVNREIANLGSRTQKQLTDKDSIITMLTEKLTMAEKKAEGFDALKDRLDTVLEELKTTQSEMLSQTKGMKWKWKGLSELLKEHRSRLFPRLKKMLKRELKRRKRNFWLLSENFARPNGIMVRRFKNLKRITVLRSKHWKRRIPDCVSNWLIFGQGWPGTIKIFEP